jgi:ribosome-associated protein
MKINTKEFIFTFSRSSGAGGQNVNKVNTKATLAWDIDHSTSIGEGVRKRFKDKFSHLITDEGLVKISSQRFRNQPQNIADCINKLYEYLTQVITPPKKRIATKPSKATIAKRIKIKKNKSEIKKSRKKII